MKKFSLHLLCLTLLLVSGCKKGNKLTQFKMDYNETIVVPSSTGISLPFDIVTPERETNAESTFQINDTRKDLIEEIKLTETKLKVTSPEGEDFSFLESISVYLAAEGLDEIRIAWNDNVPDDGATSLSLTVTDTDLKEYIKKDKFVLRCNTVTDEVLGTDYYIDVYTNFFVDAKIFKK